jgi:hypothetical protein
VLTGKSTNGPSVGVAVLVNSIVGWRVGEGEGLRVVVGDCVGVSVDVVGVGLGC